jgi:hypothetical protein
MLRPELRLEHPVDSGHRVQGSRRMKCSRSPLHQHQRCCIGWVTQR